MWRFIIFPNFQSIFVSASPKNQVIHLFYFINRNEIMGKYTIYEANLSLIVRCLLLTFIVIIFVQLLLKSAMSIYFLENMQYQTLNTLFLIINFKILMNLKLPKQITEIPKSSSKFYIFNIFPVVSKYAHICFVKFWKYCYKWKINFWSFCDFLVFPSNLYFRAIFFGFLFLNKTIFNNLCGLTV